MKKTIVLLALGAALNSYALSTANLFGGTSYGGPTKVGAMTWHVANGQAEINIALNNAGTDIWGFSFNVNVASQDFAFNVVDRERWTVRGLNTPEGIGTDLFDYSLFGPTEDQGGANALKIIITGAALSADADLFRPNTIPGNESWDAIMHGAQFGLLTDNAGHISDIHLEFDALQSKWVPTPYVEPIIDAGAAGGAVNVPDGGYTLALLALGLCGLAMRPMTAILSEKRAVFLTR